jgi:hypothetical protein
VKGSISLIGSEGFIAFLFSSDPNGIINGRHKDFAIADFSGLGRFDDRNRGRIHAVIGEDDLEFDFGQEVHGVFTAAVDFGVAFLTTKAFDFGYRHAFNADFTERIFHFLQLEWFNYRFDFLHSMLGLVGPTTPLPPARVAGSESLRVLQSHDVFRHLAPLVPARSHPSQSPVESGVYQLFKFSMHVLMTLF